MIGSRRHPDLRHLGVVRGHQRRAHGRDERLGVQAFSEGREFLSRLVKALAR